MTTQHGAARRQAHVQQIRLEQERQPRRHRQRRLLGLGTVVALVAVVSFGLWQARPTTVDATGATAPQFTLPTTTGQTVSLADLRGSPVILYFNEGAGCGSCTQQMAEIEKNPGFGEAGITVLPIVMNTAAQIRRRPPRVGVGSRARR